MTRICYVPQDAAALSVGADHVARAIAAEAERRGIDMTIIRTGSRGLLYLEPLVEIATDRGRVAYGPVAPGDVAGLFDSGFPDGADHRLGHGLTEEIPYLKQQERLTFARCGIVDPVSVDDYVAHGGFAGLKRALAISAGRNRQGSHRLGAARTRWRRFPHRHQMEDGARSSRRPEIYLLQRR